MRWLPVPRPDAVLLEALFVARSSDRNAHLQVHATVLHLMGIDHEKPPYRFQGRDFRVTDVYGKVVSKLVE